MFDAIDRRLTAIEQTLSAIERGQKMILGALGLTLVMEKLNMKTLDDVLALATQQTTLEAGVKAGIDDLNAHVSDLQSQLAAAQNAQPVDQAKIDQIADALTASNAALAAMQAVNANVPAAQPSDGTQTNQDQPQG